MPGAAVEVGAVPLGHPVRCWLIIFRQSFLALFAQILLNFYRFSRGILPTLALIRVAEVFTGEVLLTFEEMGSRVVGLPFAAVGQVVSKVLERRVLVLVEKTITNPARELPDGQYFSALHQRVGEFLSGLRQR